MRVTLVGLTLSLFGSAVGSSSAFAQCEAPRNASAASADHRAARLALLESGYRLPSSRDSLIHRFGPPQSQRVVVAPYSEQSRPDSLWRLTYPTFAVQFVKPPGASTEAMYLLELFRTDTAIAPSVSIGAASPDVLARFGSEAAVSTRGDTVRYCLLISEPDEAEEFAVFEFVRDALTRVSWLFFWG